MLSVYTDGACSGNPGPGGWAAVFPTSTRVYTVQGYDMDTTNNRMELTAIIKALKRIARYHAELGTRDYVICSDSAYCINAIRNNWVDNWRLNGWRNYEDAPVKNADLWQQFVKARKKALELGLTVQFAKVKGHANDPLNNLADELAVKQSRIAKDKAAGDGVI